MTQLAGRLALPGFLFLLAAAGCGRAEAGGDAGPTFIAAQTDFACYRSWSAFDGGTDAFDGLGTPGQRTVYINRIPPRGSTAFPLGTIIVQETEGAQTFAMAKRGGGFNPQVDDWEWFELTTADTTPPSTCAPEIDWRGATPPVGGTYGGQFTSCSNCHLQAGPPDGTNDYVAGDSLALSQL